jgi:hypothetical protein
MPDEGRKIQVRMSEEMQGGAYSNNLIVAHNRDEFILDFLFVMPPTGTVASRVITSPGHMKRILLALQDSVSKYEKTFGEIKRPPEPKMQIGFQH